MSFNQRNHTLAAVASTRSALSLVGDETEIVVVDNGSTDDTVEALRHQFPDVRVRDLQHNRGFAGGLAEALRSTTGIWVLLLNNDATIENDGVRRLLDVANGNERIGAVAAKILFADGSRTINSAGLGIDRLGVAFDRLLGLPSEAAGRDPVDVFGASAGGALLRRAMIDAIGGIDESFFMYLEDVDIAWRARALGWRSVLAPRAVVHHNHSASARHGSDFKYFLVGRNRMRLLAKYVPTSHLVRYGPAIIAYDLCYVAYAGMMDRTAAPLRGRLRGLRDWRRYRRASWTRDCSGMEPSLGLAAARARRSTWLAHSAGALGQATPDYK